MAQMTDDDYYEIKVYPKGRIGIVLRFVGDCWDVHNWEMTYNSFVAPLVRRYSSDWMTWGDRIELTRTAITTAGHWEQRVLDIKGDG
jgi:hypothetical protein